MSNGSVKYYARAFGKNGKVHFRESTNGGDIGQLEKEVRESAEVPDDRPIETGKYTEYEPVVYEDSSDASTAKKGKKECV